MPSYLLPCTCGQSTIVSAAEAGQSIRCVCGAPLEVPTLRGLRGLEPAEAAAGKPITTRDRVEWDNRHRIAFLLVQAAIFGALTAGYLAIRLPLAMVGPSDQEMEEWVRTSSTQQVFEMYRDVQQGIEPLAPAGGAPEVSRQTLLWGMGIALGTSVLAIAAAVIVMRGGARRSR
jgi:heme/copper-type cytochrome/quinol oxidase subunit 3